jgi:hypothetical protein
MRCKSISIFDFFSKRSEEENEDALRVSENSNYKLFAMSDGAGGVGIYSKEWANHIVINQPELPIQSEIESTKWFQNLSKSFYEFIKPKVNYDNIFIGERFDNEGSYATLLFVWVSQKEKKYFISGIGDTTLFHFKKTKDNYTISLIEPINKQLNIDDNPELINWQKALQYPLTSTSKDFDEGDVIVMCTDSMSRRIIYQLLLISQIETEKCLNEHMNKSFSRDFLEYLRINQGIFKLNEFIKYLWKLSEMNSDSLMKELTKWIVKNELEKDDYSLIIIEL